MASTIVSTTLRCKISNFGSFYYMANSSIFLFYTTDKLFEHYLFISSKNHINTFYLRNIFRFQLCKTSCYYNKSIRVFFYHTMYQLPTLFICRIGNGACINDNYIGLFSIFATNKTLGK